MGTHLALLHTAPVNVATFEHLAEQQAPAVPVRHMLEVALLDDARRDGITGELEQRIEHVLGEAFAGGASTILCTCSTIGGVAEALAEQHGWNVLRVDRAMAARAVELGQRITVVAALESTIEPTHMLIADEAIRAGKVVQADTVLCEGAWEAFEAGDIDGYHRRIAQCVRAEPHGDVIVLAQASMAGAAALLGDLGVPVLSSPELGWEAAVRAYAPPHSR